MKTTKPTSVTKPTSTTKPDNAKSTSTIKPTSSVLFDFVDQYLAENSSKSVCKLWSYEEENFNKVIKVFSAPKKTKKASSAYIYYTKDVFTKAKQALIDEGNEEPSIGEISGRVSEMWKSATAKSKTKYEAMAAKDRERYLTEKNGNAKNAGKRTRDPHAPKKASSAYIYYTKDAFAKAKQALIDEGNEEPSIGEISGRVSEMWQSATVKVKAKYQTMAAKDKKRYEDEMLLYKGQNKHKSESLDEDVEEDVE